MSDDIIRVFKALGDESRLRILAALLHSPSGVCTLANKLHLAQPTLSHHIKILNEAGLIIMEKEGQCKICYINTQPFNKLGLDVSKILGGFK